MPYRECLIFVANNPIELTDESSDETKEDEYLSDTDTIIKQQLI
jgi:hypothetical protein